MSDLGPEARAVLDGGREGDEPTPGDRARLRASVMRAIAAGGAIGAATAVGEGAAAAGAGSVTSAAGVAIGWKVIAGIALVGAVSAGVVVAGDRGAQQAPRAAVTAVATAPVTMGGDPPNPPARPVVVVTPPPIVETTSPVAPAAPPIAEPVPPPRPRASAAPSHAAPSAAPIAAEPQAPVPATTTVPSAEPVPPPRADTLAAETQRLREAHGALQGGDPSRALALLEEQGAAGSQLREERAAARVLALCQLGKVDEARAAAARFLQESPRSPLADRVRASCAGR